MPKVSVIIPTLNEPEHLKKCIESILKSSYKNFEIIVVDQSDFNSNLNNTYDPDSKVKYYNVLWKGKTRALNFAIKKATGDILAFTDHDCIVDNNWLLNIVKYFESNNDICILTGQVVAHKVKLKNRRGVVLPDYKLINFQKKTKIFTHPCMALTIVSGNNMAIRKKLITQVGLYKCWLGPGTKTFAGEDTEIALRSVLLGYKFAFQPAIKVYHDGYTSIEIFRKKEFLYFCGYLSVFVYFYLSGNSLFLSFIKNILLMKFNSWKRQLVESFKSFHPVNSLKIFSQIVYESIYMLRALITPIFFI